MTDPEARARELWAEQLRTAPAGEYAARSMLDSPSPHDDRVIRAITKALAHMDGEAGAFRAGLEAAAQLCDQMQERWNQQVAGFRANGNYGPYLGEPSYAEAASRIRETNQPDEGRGNKPLDPKA